MVPPTDSSDVMENPGFELASRQASLAFERTMVSVDQLLMSAIRTSLSLIGFGFAMVLFFNQIGGEMGVNLRVPARNFGLGLVAMGTLLVALGMIAHRRRFAQLTAQMDDLYRRQLLLEPCPNRGTSVALFALLLLLSGLLVGIGILVRTGPFG